jgi:pimeloyl-ACP methyl ester carboxylesterase
MISPPARFSFVHDRETLLVRQRAHIRPARRNFLLVHGIGTSSRYFERLAVCLAEHGHVHNVDLPGFGEAPQPPHPMSVSRFAGLLCAYLDAEELSDCVLVGHSMGAQIVTEMARIRPELAGLIVLIGPVVDPAAPTALQQGGRLALDMLGETPASNWAVLVAYARCGPLWYLRQLPAMLRYPMLQRFAQVQVPRLVMRGRRDTVAPRAWTRALAEAAPGTHLVEIPGAAHVAQYTAPKAVADAVLHFSAHPQVPGAR